MNFLINLKKVLTGAGQRTGLVEVPITAEIAHLQDVYNTSAANPTFHKIVEKEIKGVEEGIRSQLRWDGEKNYKKLFTSRELPLYKALQKEFEKRGFKVSLPEIPGIKDTYVLYVSWDILTKQEEDLLK